MIRFTTALTSIMVLLAACSGGGANSETESGQATGTGASTTNIAPTTGTTLATSTGGSGTATGGEGCSRDDECDADLVCVGGVCQAPECVKPVASARPLKPHMMLVLDKSASQTQLWDDDQDPGTPEVTRWSSVHHATESILTAFSSTVDIGVQLFPSTKAKDQDGLACLVAETPEVPAGPDNSAAILAKLPPPDAALAGGSALRKGLVSAISHLESTALYHPLVITIITDGMSNCAPEAEDPLDKKALYETYDTQLPDIFNYVNNTSRPAIVVVGVDGKDEFTSADVDGSPDEVNPFQNLNALASFSEWPNADPDHPDQKFYDVHDEPALIASLSTILTEIRSCTYTLDPVPGDTDLLEVTINGVVYPKPVSCLQCDDPGWRYVKPDRSQIRLYGAHCPTAEVSVRFDCPTADNVVQDPPDECANSLDCPAGQKCVPFASKGFHTFNAMKCVPIDPDPKQLGETCKTELSDYEGLDNCGLNMWCNTSGFATGQCYPTCSGDPEPACPAGTTCQNRAGLLDVCRPGCNPAAMHECIDGTVCAPNQDGVYECTPAGHDVPLFGECQGANDCAQRLQCVASQNLAQCGDASTCCLPFCSLQAPNCPDPLVCVPLYKDIQAPVEHANVGQCVSP
jgi:hypothetical protein